MGEKLQLAGTAQNPEEHQVLVIQKYDKDMEYHHVAYHMILYCSMIFIQGGSRNSEYKKRLKEKI